MVKVSLSRLSDPATALLKQIVDSIPLDQLRDYVKHIESDGVPVAADADGLRVISELVEKGWIRTNDEGIFSDRAYLTRQAWDRYQIAEWSEVEESVLMEKRNKSEFGSW